MRALTPSEHRTVRIGVIGIVLYLLLFGGFHLSKRFGKTRSDYVQLLTEARTLKNKVTVYQDRAEVTRKLMETFQMDPGKLSRTTIVAQASAAIQKAATGGGVQVGAVRESAGQLAKKELATIQLEAIGPVQGLMGFLHRLESVGYPLIVDSMQIGSDPARPGPLKMSLTIVILDFDQWKKTETEVPNAAT